MQTPPLPNRIGPRLDELNQQINRCLRDIRQHLEELERASTRPAARPGGPQKSFPELLREELGKPTPPPAEA
jgi:hypothetical protein